MSKITKIATLITSLAFTLGSLIVPFQARAAEIPPVSGLVGSWSVTNLAADKDGWRVETFKNDRDLVAWTEVNDATKARRLYAYDGVSTRLLVSLVLHDWEDPVGAAFYDTVSGNYDVADGLVVWAQFDGHDREIYSFDGSQVQQVSNNTYDDKHPVTSRGRVAWTSVPGSSYNLMVKDQAGIRRLDGFHVLNYAFSGPNLFWLNRLPNETWFRVFSNDGQRTDAVGEGDDRPMQKYFYVDGQGSAAWEYSTKNWAYDKRVIYLSESGAAARRIIQRDVPPNLLRIEAVRGGQVLLNATDLLTSMYLSNTQLILSNGFSEKIITRQSLSAKARFVEGGLIRHLVPETASDLIFNGDRGGQDYVNYDHVILDRFESDGTMAAGALLKGGVVVYAKGKAVNIPTASEVRILSVDGGNVAWIEGDLGHGILKSACQPLLVKTSAGPKYLTGHLIKSATGPAVYLAATDGKRYLFTGESQFYGWYNDFRSLRNVSGASLAALPLGGNVLYRPGYRLIKTASSPRVYTVGEQGKLQWVTNAEILVLLFGQDWSRKMLDVVPESLLADYAFGSAVDSSSRFYMAVNQ